MKGTRGAGPGDRDQDQGTGTTGPGDRDQVTGTRTRGPEPWDQDQGTSGLGPRDQGTHGWYTRSSYDGGKIWELLGNEAKLTD